MNERNGHRRAVKFAEPDTDLDHLNTPQQFHAPVPSNPMEAAHAAMAKITQQQDAMKMRMLEMQREDEMRMQMMLQQFTALGMQYMTATAGVELEALKETLLERGVDGASMITEVEFWVE